MYTYNSTEPSDPDGSHCARPPILSPAVLNEFYQRTGLTEKWLRHQINRRTWPPSKARMDRARSMAKITGQHLSKQGEEWLLVLAREAEGWKRADYKAAFARDEGRSFDDIEDELFRLLEATDGIPAWLATHHSTWLAIQALLEQDTKRR
jgi:hypothetical protein